MISLLCQKSHSGVISTSQDARSINQINELLTDHDNKSVYSEEESPTEFFKRFSSAKRGMLSRAKSFKSAPMSAVSTASQNRKEVCSRAVSFDRSTAIEDYYKQHPFRRLSSKKLKSVQKWIDQKLSEDPSNQEYYNELNELLERENRIRKEIDENLKQCEESQLRRKELLYKNWYINVYEPIQMEIYRNMSGHKADFARLTRDLKYSEYLDKVNERGCSFQDDFAPEDYDPTGVVKIDASLSKKLHDPTNIPRRKTLLEERTILNAEHGKVFSFKQIEKTKLPVIINDNQTRAKLSWNDWLLNHFGDINSTARTKSANKCKTDKISSEVSFSWNHHEDKNTRRQSTRSNNALKLKRRSRTRF